LCGSFPAVQMKFTPIIHPSISYHCVGVQVSDTHYALFWAGFIEWVITSQVIVMVVVGGLNILALNG